MNGMAKFKCRVCRNEAGNRRYVAREMLFGWRDTFEYVECGHCGCIQIAEIPEDMERYYPNDYYAYKAPINQRVPRISNLKRLRNRALLGQRVPFGNVLARASRPPGYFAWFSSLGIDLNASILDIGCGTGSLLLRMRKAGFSRLTGADPFISNDIDYGGGLKIHKAGIDHAPGNQDVVMANHSFEHMPDPLGALRALRRLLRPSGALLIRIPVAGCYAWRKYGVDWAALDAPRHLHLHTTKSMTLLAAEAGLRVERIFYDSDSHQVINSELHARNIPSLGSEGAIHSLFPESAQTEIANFARHLNEICDGDRAGFILRPTAVTESDHADSAAPANRE